MELPPDYFNQQSTVNEVPDNLPREFDMDKVKTTLKQLIRDWSDAGAVERECCYSPVIRELLNIYPKEWYVYTQKRDATLSYPHKCL